MIRAAKVFAPGSIGNVGPGFDVLGLAIIGLGVTVSVEPDGEGPRIAEVTGRDARELPKDVDRNAAALAAILLYDKAGVKPFFRLSMENGLPFSGGLGGSATAAVAGAAAALLSLGRDLDPKPIMRCALEAEEMLSGRHMDNIAAALYGGLTLTRDIESLDVVKLPVVAPWHIALMTPKVRVATKRARSILPETWARSLWTKQMAQTAALVHAFGSGDEKLLGRALEDGFAEPLRAGLIPNFKEIKQAALDAGAYGCSISGSGPTMFAITGDAVTARLVVAAMGKAAGGEASLVHECAIGEKGLRPL
ncbi:MAG TPA: homoserine kinase [Gammaproteobacteria bacterium]|nr:homoserine kinase [Gammaproteobacteria bacterium]